MGRTYSFRGRPLQFKSISVSINLYQWSSPTHPAITPNRSETIGTGSALTRQWGQDLLLRGGVEGRNLRRDRTVLLLDLRWAQTKAGGERRLGRVEGRPGSRSLEAALLQDCGGADNRGHVCCSVMSSEPSSVASAKGGSGEKDRKQSECCIKLSKARSDCQALWPQVRGSKLQDPRKSESGCGHHITSHVIGRSGPLQPRKPGRFSSSG